MRSSSPMRRPCAKRDLGIWQTWSWAATRARGARARLRAGEPGLQPGDHLAIVGANRPHLYMAVLAAQVLRGVPVPLYQDAVAGELVFMLDDAEVDSRSPKTRSRSTSCSSCARSARSSAHLLRRPARPAPLRPAGPHVLREAARRRAAPATRRIRASSTQRWPPASPHDVAVILYTSGTTGPQGRVQTHASFIAAGRAAWRPTSSAPATEVMSYLPLAWVGQNIFCYAQWLVGGFTSTAPSRQRP